MHRTSLRRAAATAGASLLEAMQFRVLGVLALRNLRRQVRRTLLTASAMIVGGILLVFAFSLSDGTHEQWIESGVRLGSGHVSVERPEFRLSRRIEDRLGPEIREAVEQALRSPAISERVVAFSSKIRVQGLASSAAGSRPVEVAGVHAHHEADFGKLDDQVVEGRYLEPGDRLQAYVGAALADSLGLRLGSRFVVQTQDTEGEISGQLLRVAGIFRSGLPAVDQTLIHIPLSTAWEWLGAEDSVTGIGIVLDSSTATEPVRAHLEQVLEGPAERGEIRVLGWRESDPGLSAALTIDDLGNYLVLGLLFAIIGFGIVNTVLMSVMHRHREFGVLQALGLTPRQTGAVVLVEGLSLTAVSGLLGVALGLFITWYLFGDGLDMTAMMENMDQMTFGGAVVDPVMVPLFRGRRIVEITLFILGMGILASIYPAFRAARIDVAESMKFER